MATPYTSDDLLEQMQRAGSLPAASGVGTGTDSGDLLAHADCEVRDTLIPLMLGMSEEFYQRTFDVPVVPGQADYRINKRTTLSRISNVQLIYPGSGTVNLQRIEPKRAADLTVTGSTGMPWAFFLEGSRVVLFPTPGGTGTLRMRATTRPGRLTIGSTTGTLPITAVSGSIAAGWTLTLGLTHGYTTSSVLDVVSGTPSFEYLALDQTPSAFDTTTITIAGSSTSTAPAVGDYVCAPDTSPFIQLPVELHPALVELAIARVLRSLGQKSEAKDHADEATRLVKIGISALTPRTEEVEQIVTGGPFWRNGGDSWGGW